MASNTDNAQGIDGTPTGNPSATKDVFATTTAADPNTDDDSPFSADKLAKIAGPDDMKMPDNNNNGTSGSPTRDRRESKEWDASRVPPSRFQKRSGSIYSTPSSRDAHLDGSERDKSYWEKMKEKGWIKK